MTDATTVVFLPANLQSGAQWYDHSSVTAALYDSHSQTILTSAIPYPIESMFAGGYYGVQYFVFMMPNPRVISYLSDNPSWSVPFTITPHTSTSVFLTFTNGKVSLSAYDEKQERQQQFVLSRDGSGLPTNFRIGVYDETIKTSSYGKPANYLTFSEDASTIVFSNQPSSINVQTVVMSV